MNIKGSPSKTTLRTLVSQSMFLPLVRSGEEGGVTLESSICFMAKICFAKRKGGGVVVASLSMLQPLETKSSQAR